MKKTPEEFSPEEKAEIAKIVTGNPMILDVIRTIDPMSMTSFLYAELPFFRSKRENQVIDKAQKKIGLGIVGSLAASTFISVMATPHIISLSKWIRYPLRLGFFGIPFALTAYYSLAPAYDSLMVTHMNISRRVMRLARSGRVEDFFV